MSYFVHVENMKINNHDAEPMLRSCGVSIGGSFTQVEGSVLLAPKLKVGNVDEFFPLKIGTGISTTRHL